MTSTMAHRPARARTIDVSTDICSPVPVPVDGNGVDTVSRTEGGDHRIGPKVEQATALLAGVVADLDPSRLTGPDASKLYELFAGVERLSMAGKTLLAPRIDDSGVWRDTGHRTPAAMLAELEGVPTGQARNTLEVGQRLHQLPGTEDALRSGVLSGAKVSELSGAAVLDPAGEAALLQGAAEQPLQLVKERCQRSRATSVHNDPVAAVRRIRRDRHFTWWTDGEGAFCYNGRDTADRGARILQQMDHTAGRLRRSEVRTPRTAGSVADPDPDKNRERNRRADAFYLLVTGRSPIGRTGPHPATSDMDVDPGPPLEHIAEPLEFGGAPPGRAPDGSTGVASRGTPGREPSPDDTPLDDDLIDRPPSCSVMVRVDLDALLRGVAHPGEICEIDNQAPISVAMARDMANDSFLRFVFHQAGDIRAISHFGRTINRQLRTALAHRDRCCVVPGCGVSYGLEIDHVQPFAQGGPTELDNLALLCHHHHFLKTYEGWTLERRPGADGGPIAWTFTPLPPFGQEREPPGR